MPYRTRPRQFSGARGFLISSKCLGRPSYIKIACIWVAWRLAMLETDDALAAEAEYLLDREITKRHGSKIMLMAIAFGEELVGCL